MYPALFLARVKVACNTTTLSNFIICLVALEKATIRRISSTPSNQQVAGNNSAFFSRLTDDDD